MLSLVYFFLSILIVPHNTRKCCIRHAETEALLISKPIICSIQFLRVSLYNPAAAAYESPKGRNEPISLLKLQSARGEIEQLIRRRPSV